MTVVLVDTSVWARRAQPDVARAVAQAIESRAAAIVAPIALELLRSARDSREYSELVAEYGRLYELPLTSRIGDRARRVQGLLVRRGYHRGLSAVDLLAAAAAESATAEVWHCDRHFELIGEVTGQPMRRVGR